MASISEIPDEGLPHKSFQEFYEHICNKIRATGALTKIMSEFEKFQTDFERVKYVAKMEDVQNLYIKTVVGKNAHEAEKLELEYDKLNNTEENAYKAKIVISKSIQVTPSQDKDLLAIRFMKRAWASLLQEKFDQAFIDAVRSLSYGAPPNFLWNSYEILGHCYAKESLYRKADISFQKALEALRNSNYPNEVKAKSTKRILLVYKNIKGRKDVKEKNQKDNTNPLVSLKVSYGPNEVLTSASKAVEVGERDGRGRGLYATRKINPGDIIIVEEPFAVVQNLESLDLNCNQCFQKVDTPLPCPTCSSVWFCDEKCLEDGLDGLHQHECKILPHLYDPCIGKMALLVFRIMYKATWKKLKIFRDIDQESLPTNDGQNSGWLQGHKQYSTEDYWATYQLVTNATKRSFGDLFKRTLSAIYIVACLKATNFGGENTNENDLLYATSLALHHLQGSSCNAYAVTEYSTEGNHLEWAEGREIGGAIYPTVSLTNHSCCPNTFRYICGTSCILRATKCIDKGDEIFDNYGPQFQAMPLSQRRELLQSQYKFNCECPACLEDWPLYPHSKALLTFTCPEYDCGELLSYVAGSLSSCVHCKKSEKCKQLIKDIESCLSDFQKAISIMKNGNVTKALSLLLNNTRFLDKSSVRPPSKHLTDVEETLRRVFVIDSLKGIREEKNMHRFNLK